MKIAIQVPIKGRSSTRVPNKNFRDLNGKPLCYWVLDELVKLPADIDIFIDSEEEIIFQKLAIPRFQRFKFHKRKKWFSHDQANGNHLIHQFALDHLEYDAYAQIYVTAVTLKEQIISNALEAFRKNSSKHDSLFLATEESGWVWFKDEPINYDPLRPHGLPRSQDATYIKETTGLYAIEREAVLLSGCRIGSSPYIFKIDHEYAMDIDTMSDFIEAEKLLSLQNI